MSTREYPNPIPSGYCQMGARRLQLYAMRTFNLTDLGCYNPDSHMSGGGPSWHVHGEAIDLGCNYNDANARARGTAWFEWLIAHKEELNLQQAIWGNMIYDVSYGRRVYSHTDHYNHIHSALGHDAAANWREPAPVAQPTAEDHVESVWYLNTMHSFWMDTNNQIQHNHDWTFVENMSSKYGLPACDRGQPLSVTAAPNGGLYVRAVGAHGELIVLNFDSVHGWGKDVKLPVS